MSKRSWLAFLLAMVMCSAVACAQGGVYAEGHRTWVSGKTVGGDSASGPSGKATALGGTFGAFYDFLQIGPVALGADVRYSFAHDGSPSIYGNELNYGAANLRFSGKIPAWRVRPYVQAGVLRGSTNYAQYTSIRGGFGYDYQVGTDVGIAPHLDARVEYSGGQVGDLSSSIGTTSVNFHQIAGGFVIWFGR
jgi:hypothetical protein